MPTHLEGKLLLANESIAVVVSRFNDMITSRLLAGALDTIRRHGGDESQVVVVHVPGAFEIPLAAAKLASSGKFAAVICLGAVIAGQTTHDQYINHQVAGGIARASQDSGVPVLFGVLTCQNMEQAIDRAGGKAGNKGHEAALAAIEMINVLREIDALSKS